MIPLFQDNHLEPIITKYSAFPKRYVKKLETYFAPLYFWTFAQCVHCKYLNAMTSLGTVPVQLFGSVEVTLV